MDRAQFLQGLRTGGPRPSPFGNQPLSANPTVSRFQAGLYDDEVDNTSFQQQQHLNANMTMLQQQQQQLMMMQAQAQVAAMMAAQGGGPAMEAQALQLQMEIVRLQALHQQQNFQTQMMLQSQLANQTRRRSEVVHAMSSPHVASPAMSSFPDFSTAQQSRLSAASQLRARAVSREALVAASAATPTIAEENAPPTTTSKLGPKTGTSQLNPNATAFVGRFNPDLAAAIAAATITKPSEPTTPATPTYGATTVISGGTSLGGMSSSGTSTPTATPSNSFNGLSGYSNSAASPAVPTKSDSAMSWRRGSTTSTPVSTTPSQGFNSPPSSSRSTSPPALAAALNKLSLSANGNSVSPSSSNGSFDSPNATVGPMRIRPSPLRFTKPGSAETNITSSPRSNSPGSGSIDGNEHDREHDGPSPVASTPPSSAGSDGGSSKRVGDREEASKRLYEGLGLGRPAPSPPTQQPSRSVTSQFNVHAAPFSLNINTNMPGLPTFTTTAATPSTPTGRAMSMPASGMMMNNGVPSLPQPHRQPIGPPSSVDELGDRNFASRMRKKALGGLGVLMSARDRRESFVGTEVVAY